MMSSNRGRVKASSMSVDLFEPAPGVVHLVSEAHRERYYATVVGQDCSRSRRFGSYAEYERAEREASGDTHRVLFDSERFRLIFCARTLSYLYKRAPRGGRASPRGRRYKNNRYLAVRLDP